MSAANFTGVPRESTAQVLAAQLRAALARGELKPGDRLVEADLADAFDVSRGPVREAIRLLANEGLVVLRKNRGAVVATPTLDEVLEVYAVRREIGTIAIRHAVNAGLFKDDRASEIQRLLTVMTDPEVQADRLRMVDADLAFQAALVRSGALPRVSDIFEQTAMEVRLFVQLLNPRYDFQDHRTLIERHGRLADLMAVGDLAGAIELWQEHIRITVREFTEAFAATIGVRDDRPMIDYLF
jgi:DNA-binding GntR family transcriptional regulator